MNSFVKSDLNKGEHIIKEAKFSMVGAVPWLITWLAFAVIGIILLIIAGSFTKELYFLKVQFAVTGILFIALGFLPYIFARLDIKNTELAVTNFRIIGKHGILSKHTVDLRLDKVDVVSLQTTFFGNKFNYSTIKISGSGDGNPQNFTGLCDGSVFKKAINEAITNYPMEIKKLQNQTLTSSEEA